MRIVSFVIAGSLLGVLTVCGTQASDLNQPMSVRQTAFEYDGYTYFAPQEDASQSPSDQPAEVEPVERAGSTATCDPGCNQRCGQARCGRCGGDPWTLPQPGFLARRGIRLGGWIDQGFTTNSRNPANPAAGIGNLPTAFNYRNDEYQLNQLYTFLERQTDTGGWGWDIGGRVDLLYGEDYIFTQAAGLEMTPDAVNHWNSSAGHNGLLGTARMGLAMPQMYGEVAYNDVKVKLGHFYTIIGYETVTAPDNFFYSHALTMLIGEPFTHTGALATWEASDQWSISGGIVNGWDKFDALSDRAAFLGGVTWTSPNQATSLGFNMIMGDENGVYGVVMGNRTMYSLVLAQQLTERLQYVLQHDLAVQDAGGPYGSQTQWYALNQYLFYTINACWSAGVRYEWYYDDWLTSASFDDPNGGPVQTYSGDWYELTLGLNYKPTGNIVVRPELRWDWFDRPNPAADPGPFANFTRGSQFTAACDLIVTY